MNKRILFVDDDPRILLMHQKLFGKKYEVELADDPGEALAKIKAQEPYAVIVTDMQMPAMSGTELLEEARQLSPQTVGIILTASLDQETATEAINKARVYRFLTKPYSRDAIFTAVEDALVHYDWVVTEREIFEQTVAGSVKVLTDVLALSEPQSFAVGQKLRDFVQCFIKATPVFDAWAMEIAALLSQVGYVTIPRTIIEKRSRRQALTEEEARMVLQVPQVGHDLISHIPRLARAAKIVLYQHKNYDGSGFPEDGVSGEEIPYGARLFRILLELIEGEGHYVTKAETVLRMRSKPHYFDAKLVDLIEKNLAIKAATPKLIYVDKLGYIPDRRTGGQSAEAAAQSPAPIREINLAELQPGDRLASDVSTFENLMVVAAGSEITPLILTRIVNFGSIHRLRERVLIVA